MLELLQLAGVEQLPQTSTAPWGETIADEIAWIGLFATISTLGRRYLMGELLPDEMPAVDFETVAADRDPRDRFRLWACYGLGTAATTAGVYLLTTLAIAVLWFGLLAFVGAVGALVGYRSGTPLDDVRLLAAARQSEPPADDP